MLQHADGRASVPVASLTATPIRRSPTSRPATRPTSYNSRIPHASSIPRPVAVAVMAIALAVAIASGAGAHGVVRDAGAADHRPHPRASAGVRASGGRSPYARRRSPQARDRARSEERAGQAGGRADGGGRTGVRQTTDRLASLELQRLAQLPDMKPQLVDVYKRGRSGYARLLFGAQRRARVRARRARRRVPRQHQSEADGRASPHARRPSHASEPRSRSGPAISRHTKRSPARRVPRRSARSPREQPRCRRSTRGAT